MSDPEDTCRPVEIDGEIIRVHGSRDMTDVERGYLAEIVRAAKARMEAEAASKPARCDDTELLVTECACKTCRPDLAKVEPAEPVKAHHTFIAKYHSRCDPEARAAFARAQRANPPRLPHGAAYRARTRRRTRKNR